MTAGIESEASVRGRDVLSEARRKRTLALDAAARAGFGAVVASDPATVRWLLCGRGRPVDVGSADYTVVLTPGSAAVLYADIEQSRVAAEERFEELGLEPVPFPWHERKDATVAELLGGAAPLPASALELAIAPHRRELDEGERERYRAAGAAAADAFTFALRALRPEQRELDAAGLLADEARRRDLVPRVLLVAGEERQPLHRHPLPTEAPLGRHALLALTAELEGLHVSLTRIVSFGSPPAEVNRLVRLSAEVDEAMLVASRPGVTLASVIDTAARAYAERGFPDEWRRHHQGGLTGYRGREVFCTPTERTTIPSSAAVAWNPSITGGGKSEDTALVSAAAIEVVTRTPDLPELALDTLPRPAIVVV
jgi:antitoxin VapB